MYTISKTFAFCYGHRLLGDEGRCRNLHGHTGRATFVLARDGLDQRGMVEHFDRLKDTIGRWISENLDHAMLLCEIDPMAKVMSEHGERYFPMKENPTAENIAKVLFDAARGFGLPVVRVELWESETSKASYEI